MVGRNDVWVQSMEFRGYLKNQTGVGRMLGTIYSQVFHRIEEVRDIAIATALRGPRPNSYGATTQHLSSHIGGVSSSLRREASTKLGS
jgi:hypothetical protein